MYYSTFGLEQLIESRMMEANQERNLVRMSRKAKGVGFRDGAKKALRVKRNNKFK